jgi:hypothetical protein
MKTLWRMVLRGWHALRWRRRLAPPARPCRLWRQLPIGRAAVHLYVPRLDDLEAMSRRRYALGTRVYVTSLGLVYQWTEGRREEVDGGKCLFPVDVE